MLVGRDICKDNPEDFPDGRLGGTYIEYPTVEEVIRFTRELSFEERLPVLSQGFRSGASYEYFYTLEKFVGSLLRRKSNAPALGVRELERSTVIPWIRDVVGDVDLARALEDVFDHEEHMQTVVDEVRIIMALRMEQYDEVLEGFSDAY